MTSTTTNTTASTPSKCSQCHDLLASPVLCAGCQKLYPIDGIDYFTLLGLWPKYDVDPADVRRKYLEISRGAHPDRHPGDDASLSLRISAQLNEAHRVLIDPVLRAEYLLEIHGGKAAADDRSVPQAVLQETLLLREEIAEAKTDGNEAVLQTCRVQIQQGYDATLEQVAELARKLPGDEALRQSLRTMLNAMKYYQKLLAEC